MNLGLSRKTIRIDKYNLGWREEYLKVEKELNKVLENYDVEIQHIGSTSIVGCSAKPIIDIAIGVPNLEYGKQLIPLLQAVGWNYEGTADYGVRWFLTKGCGDISTHFIHIEDRFKRVWQNHIVFRDYLNSHPDKVLEYSNLKERIVKEFTNNRHDYSKIKTPFIEETIRQALKEWDLKPVGEDYKI